MKGFINQTSGAGVSSSADSAAGCTADKPFRSDRLELRGTPAIFMHGSAGTPRHTTAKKEKPPPVRGRLSRVLLKARR